MKKTPLVIALIMFEIVAMAQRPLRLWYDRPAKYFEESLPIGNGKLGALVFGSTVNDTVYLNDITYWTGQPVSHAEGQGKSKWIAPIRKALFNEDYELADSLQHYVQGAECSDYQPLGTLNIINENIGAVTAYRRELDLDSSLVKISYIQGGVDYHREYFASYPDSLIAIKLSASKRGCINSRIMLTAQVPHDVRASDRQLTMIGHAVGDAGKSIHACTILRVINEGGTVSASDSTLTLRDVDVATIYVVNSTSFRGALLPPDDKDALYISKAVDEAWHTQNVTYDAVRNRHVQDYQRLFKRVDLTLGNGMIPADVPTDQLLRTYTARTEAKDVSLQEYNPYDAALETLYFQYGRYLLVSCSRCPGVPANLQGLWTPYLWSPWHGDYTMNINLEENYWHAEVANLPEMTMPLVEFIEALSVNGGYTAKNFYGITSGWCCGHNSDIWAKTAPVGGGVQSPKWSNWNMGGAWIVNTLWEHYLFSLDKDYLRSVAYPAMKGAAEFCSRWLVVNPRNPKELITAPSTSPEAQYVTDEGYTGSTCYGGTADLAIIRELFANTISAARILGDKALAGLLQSQLDSLHPYTVGHMGDINEWYYDWDDKDFHHRHQSHLIGLYPGNRFPRSLYPAARRSLEIKGDESTGWSTGWRINLWARLGDGNHAYRMYRNLLRYVSPQDYNGLDAVHRGGTYPNLFDAHPPFQIDGNFGGTAGVCEMLLQSTATSITLLPALPDAWSDGSVTGLRARGDITVEMSWCNGKVKECTLYSTRKRETTLKVNDTVIKVRLKKGNNGLYQFCYKSE